jgi:creatinine amidohydrolase/Fe(II)-dependent formamide hydrolase-like protein
MRMEYMFPSELDRVKHERIPVMLALGTIEYHGPHCSFGCDTLIAQGLLERLEQEMEICILPPVWYGVSSYAVAGPEKGTIHVPKDALEVYLHGLFSSLIEGGVRNIVILIQHQFSQGNYMPTTLAAASAAKAVTMEYLESTRGRGWWGDNTMSDFYNKQDAADNPFNWIRILPCMSSEVQKAVGYDHAGIVESSLLMALYPDAIRLNQIELSNEWFIQTARKASNALGEKIIKLCLDDLRAKIKG